MQTTDHLIVSLLKKDINSPWLISTMDSEGLIFTYSIGLGGKSATGPKLKDILDEIDSKPKSYPYEYGMHLISNPLNRTVILNIVGEMISFTEITMQTKMFMMKDMKNKPLISPASKIKLNEDISILSISLIPLFINKIGCAKYLKDSFVLFISIKICGIYLRFLILRSMKYPENFISLFSKLSKNGDVSKKPYFSATSIRLCLIAKILRILGLVVCWVTIATIILLKYIGLPDAPFKFVTLCLR